MRPLLTAVLATTCLASALAGQEPYAIERVALRATLGAGFETTAELTRPAGLTGDLPAVLLVHGASPADKDFTVARRPGDTTRVFRDIADALARAGIASLRYDKRWVSAPGRFDMMKFVQTDLQALLADARTMLDTLRRQPGVDVARVIVWGWSEGSAIAAQMAAHDDIAGVVVQGPVVTSFHETLGAQFERIGLPYLLRFAAADSTLDLARITEAETGDGGLLARSHATMLLDPFALQRGERRINGIVDADSSGSIHLTREALATYRRFFSDGPMLGMYSSARALPGWSVMADSTRVPVLVLHGTHDANIDVSDAQRLAEQVAGDPRFTFRVYPGLGHSLGAAPDAIRDDFRSVDAAPLRDAASWIRGRYGR